MLIVIYHPDGKLVPDVKTMEYAEELAVIANNPDTIDEVKVSQSLVIDAIRVLISRGVINASDIAFRFDGQLICSNERGKLDKWPVGFCDTQQKYLVEILSGKRSVG